MNLDGEEMKAKARKIWIKTKPLTPEEKDEIKTLKKQVEKLKNLVETQIIESDKRYEDFLNELPQQLNKLKDIDWKAEEHKRK